MRFSFLPPQFLFPLHDPSITIHFFSLFPFLTSTLFFFLYALPLLPAISHPPPLSTSSSVSSTLPTRLILLFFPCTIHTLPFDFILSLSLHDFLFLVLFEMTVTSSISTLPSWYWCDADRPRPAFLHLSGSLDEYSIKLTKSS